MLFGALPAFAQSMPLRTDVPFWSEYEDGVWPQRAVGPDFIGFGSRFALGDWTRTDADCTRENCKTWVRLRIRGASDGGFIWEEASEPQDLDSYSADVAVIAELADIDDHTKLYAVQIGFSTGSSYLIVSVTEPAEGLIKRMTILAPDCSKRRRGVTIRRASVSSVFLTEYCVAQSKAALRQLALDALNRTPLGVLE